MALALLASPAFWLTLAVIVAVYFFTQSDQGGTKDKPDDASASREGSRPGSTKSDGASSGLSSDETPAAVSPSQKKSRKTKKATEASKSDAGATTAAAPAVSVEAEADPPVSSPKKSKKKKKSEKSEKAAVQPEAPAAPKVDWRVHRVAEIKSELVSMGFPLACAELALEVSFLSTSGARPHPKLHRRPTQCLQRC